MPESKNKKIVTDTIQLIKDKKYYILYVDESEWEVYTYLGKIVLTGYVGEHKIESSVYVFSDENSEPSYVLNSSDLELFIDFEYIAEYND